MGKERAEWDAKALAQLIWDLAHQQVRERQAWEQQTKDEDKAAVFATVELAHPAASGGP